MFAYRPYQSETFEAARDALQRGVNRQLACLPTGMGKSILFSAMGKELGISKRQLLLVHREELVLQAHEHFMNWNPGYKVGIEMGQDHYASDNDDIIVASVATLGRAGSKRLSRFHPNDFGLVLVDEAHHATADSYGTVFEHFGIGNDSSNSGKYGVVLSGVTATPNRTDKQGLGKFFDEIIYQKDILTGIREGWLVDIRGVKVYTKTNLDGVAKITDSPSGDDNLASAINTPSRNKLIVSQWLAVAGTATGYRPTVAFCANIKHSQDLAEEFNNAGIKAAAIWSGDPNRAAKLRAHREGRLQVLTNFGILTEGYDDWRISCIIMARPTKSALTFTQMVGRGTRIPSHVDNLIAFLKRGEVSPKIDCIVLDVVDSTSRHSLVSLPSLFGLAPKTDMKQKSITEVLDIVEDVQNVRPQIDLSTLTDIDQLTTEDVNLFEDKTPPEVVESSKLRWVKTADGSYQINLPNNEHVRVYADLLDKWVAEGTVNGSYFKIDKMNALPEAFRVADQYITMFGKNLMDHLRRVPKKPVKESLKPHAELATITQKIFVKNLYANNPKVMAALERLTKREARALIHQGNG